MPVCLEPHASLESGVGEHAGKAIPAFPGIYVEVAKVSMEGPYCGTNGRKVYFPLTRRLLRKQQRQEKGGLPGAWESVQLWEQERWLNTHENERKSCKGQGVEEHLQDEAEAWDRRGAQESMGVILAVTHNIGYGT